MIKKTITYTDIDDRTVTEEFLFNLTKIEMIELEVGKSGGYSDAMQRIIDSKDSKEILATIKEIVLAAYGERSTESRHFIKKPELAEAFSHTEAYSVLLMELFEDAQAAADFFNGLMPKDLVEQVTNARPAPQDRLPKAVPTSTVKEVTDVVLGDEINKPVGLTTGEFNALSADEAQAYIRRGGKII